MFVTIPTFTIFNKIKVVVRLCGQLAGHECAATRPYRLGYVPIIIGKWYKSCWKSASSTTN
jgi:hypothetical protein